MSVDVVIRVEGQASTEWLDALQSKLGGLSATLDRGIGGDAFDRVASGAGRASAGVADVGESAEAAGRGFLDLGRIADVALGSLAADAIAKVGGAIASLPGDLLDLAGGFEAAYGSIRAGTGATGDALAGLEQSFRTVFSSVPADAGTAAQTVADLNTRLGLTGSELEGVAQRMLQLDAIGFDASVENVSRTFGDWGVATERQGAALDRLFAVSQATGPSVDRIGQLMVQYGAPLRQMGFGFDEAAVMMGKWEREGVNTELGMGSLRVAIGNFARDGVPLREGLDQTIAKIQELGPGAAATALAMDTFGARAGPDMAAAILEGKFAIDELMASVRDAETIGEAADAALTFGQRWQIVKNQVLTAIAPIIETVGDFAGQIVGLLGGAAEAAAPMLQMVAADISHAFSQLAVYLPTIDQVRAAVQGLAVVFVLVRDAVGAAIPPIIAGVQMLLPVVAGVAAGIAIAWAASAAAQVAASISAAGGLLPFIAAQAAAGAAAVTAAATAAAAWLTALGPFTLVGIAVGALAGLWIANVGGIQEKTAEVVEWLKGAWAEIPEALSSAAEAVSGFATGVAGFFEGMASAVSSKVSALWDTAVGLFSAGIAAVVGFVQGLRDDVLSAWESLRVGVSGTVADLAAWVSEAWGSLSDWLADTVQAIADNIAAAWDWIAETVSSVVDWVVEWVSARWAWLGGVLRKLFSTYMTLFHKVWSWIWKVVTTVARAVANRVVAAFHWLGGAIGRIWDAIVELLGKAWDLILGIFRSAAGPIAEGVAALFTKIAEIARDGMTAVSGIVGKVFGAIADKLAGFAGLLGPASGLLDGIVAKMRDGAGGMLSSIGSGIGALIDKIKGGVGGVVDFFKGKIEGAREKVAGFFEGGPEQETGGDEDPLGAFAAPDLGGDSGGGGLPGGGGKGKKAKTAKAKKSKKGSQAKKSAEELAKTMADIASKVSEAVKEGLDALRELMKTDIPGEAVWGPKLDQINAFIAGSLERMQTIGTTMFREVGQLAEGETLHDTKPAQAIEAASDLLGGVLGAVVDSATFLQSLTRARFPDQAKVDESLGRIGELLAHLRDKGAELAAHFEDQAAVDKFAALAEGMKAWGEVFSGAVGSAIALGESAEALEAAPAGLARVGEVLDATIAKGGEIIAAIESRFDDEGDREAALDLSGRVAEILSAWVGLVGETVAATEGLDRAVDRMPADAAERLGGFWRGVAGVVGSMLRGDGYDLTRDVDRALAGFEVADKLADTLARIMAPVEATVKVASELRQVARIPAGAAEQLGAFWREVAGVLSGMLRGDGYDLLADRERTVGDLAVADALASTLTGAVGLVEKSSAALRALVDLPEFDAGAALARIESIMSSAAGMLARMLRGPGYDLLADRERTLGDFGVVSALVGVLAQAVDLVRGVAAAGAELAAATPIAEADLGRALAGAELVRDAVARLVEGWGLALREAGKWADEITAEVKEYGAQLGAAIAVAQAAAGLRLSDVAPIDRRDLDQALANGFDVLWWVQKWAETWRFVLERAGLELEAVGAEVAAFADQVKTALGVASASAGLELGEVEPIDTSALDRALANAIVVEDRVRALAASWKAGLDRAEVLVETTAEEVKAFAAQIRESLGLAGVAAGFALGEVAVLDIPSLDRALANAEAVRSRLQALAASWAAAIRDAGGTMAGVVEEMESFSAVARAALDLAGAAAGLVVEGVRKLSADMLARALGNAEAVYLAVAAQALAWAEGVRQSGRTLEGVRVELEAWAGSAGVAVELVARVMDLMQTFADRGSNVADVASIMPRVRDQLVTIVRELAAVFDQVEQESGTLKRALDASNVVGPAADALGKVFGALSFESLLKSPLVDTKLRSGFMRKVAQRRLDALASQMVEGIRRTVGVLVEGLRGIVVPDGIGDGLDYLAGVYERLASVLERLSGMTIDSGKVRELVAAAALLAMALPGGAGQVPPGGGLGFGGGAPVTPGDPDPFSGAGGSPRGPALMPIGPGGGGAGLPVEPGRPVALSAELRVSSPVMLDGEQIGAAVERIVRQRGVATTIAPEGG